jgi:UDP:flavonoid glycosyltransferase YjiC (YdhE family)
MVSVLATCREVGHDVLVACPDSFTPAVQRLGFATAAFDDAPREEWTAVMSRLPGLPADEANRIVVRDVFGRIDTSAALPRLSSTVARWRPDLVIRDPTEFASWLAAERAGVPHVRVSISLLSADRTWARIAAGALTELVAAQGLPADPDGARLSGAPVLAAAPASFDPPGELPARLVHRYAEPVTRSRSTPPQIPAGDEPLVYVTFGTVAATVGAWPGLYRGVLDALADVAVRILVTTGQAVDPSELGPLPARAAVMPFVPQDEVLANTRVMVAHGGFGTVLGALRAGVPMVLAPLFADQPYNAERVVEVGAGIAVRTSLDPGVVPVGLPGEVRAGVIRLLDDPGPRAAASRLAAEMAAQPAVASLVARLESVAAHAS